MLRFPMRAAASVRLLAALCLPFSSLAADREPPRRTVLTIPPKPYLKMDHLELGSHVGMIVNDPFVTRTLIGGSANWHMTDVLGIELHSTFSPDLGEADWKQITHQLVHNNQVVPELSKILYNGQLTTQFSPVYGKVAGRRGLVYFDMYGVVGVGTVLTHDILDPLGLDSDSRGLATEVEWHATVVYGAGARIAIGSRLAVRTQGTVWHYVETINGTSLLMKPAFAMTVGVSWLVPLKRDEDA